MKIKKRNRPYFWLIILAVLILIQSVLLGVWLDYQFGRKTIQTYDTVNGHRIEIIEIGHRSPLMWRHHLQIVVDDSEFVCFYSWTERSRFISKDNLIVVEEDDSIEIVCQSSEERCVDPWSIEFNGDCNTVECLWCDSMCYCRTHQSTIPVRRLEHVG